MKLFDLLFQRKNSEEKQLELRLDRSHLIDRSKVDSDAIDRMQRVPASEEYYANRKTQKSSTYNPLRCRGS